MPDRAVTGPALASRPEKSTRQGERVWTYRDGDFSVVVLPDRGAKLASIRSGPREWMTQPQKPLLALDAIPPLLVQGDMFGWDECAPTIDDCVWNGESVPLHGDAWNQPWAETAGDWLEVAGRALPYRLARHLTLTEHGFRLEYRASADRRMPFLWSAHPQFAATLDSVVIFADGQAPLIDVFGKNFWGAEGPQGPVAVGSLPERTSAKLFFAPEMAIDGMRLEHADKSSLSIRWDATFAPYAGVWMDRASIGPVNAVALEPMSGYYDSLTRAATAGRVAWLEPGIEVQWWLEVGVKQGPGRPHPVPARDPSIP